MTSQFKWYRACGLFVHCNQWVDEIYPKIKDMLPAALQDGIKVSHYGWKTWDIGLKSGGHEALKITVSDDPKSKTNNSFVFYLDDGHVGGSDHFFVDEEVNEKWTERLNLLMTGRNETLEDLKLNPPIGPGRRPHLFHPI